MKAILGVILFITFCCCCFAGSLKSRVRMETSTPIFHSKPTDVPTGGLSMYELSTRPWLYALSKKYGRSITTLNDIPDEEFQTIKSMNIDMVWMMGVWHLGPYGLKHDRTDPGLLAGYAKVLPGYTMDDIIGSPYAVTNYTANPELGTDADILALKQRLNSMGLKLMLDFVPNHSAVDCDWTSTNVTFYVRAPKGTQPPYDSNIYLPNGIAYGSVCSGCGSWTDTAQFNYWDSGLRAARIQELMHVASLADGVRCDMAYLLLNDQIQQNWSPQLNSWGYTRPQTEWWSDAITAVKQKYPNVVFLAEVYYPWQQPLQNVGFDFTYDKSLYDRLGDGNLDNIRGWLTSNSLTFHRHSAHFISNHDEERAVDYFGSWWRANAAALLTYTLPGMRFFWMWQFDGYKNRLDVHLRREASEPVVQDVQNFYNQFLPIVTADVFKKGQWTYLDVFGADSSWRLISYRWEYGNQKRLCIINYSDTQGEGRVIVSNASPVNGNDTIPVTDLLSGQTYYRSANDMKTNGLYVVINPWYAQIFEY